VASGAQRQHARINLFVTDQMQTNRICLFILFVYLKSTTEGPEGLLYCRRYKNTQIYTILKHAKKQTNKK